MDREKVINGLQIHADGCGYRSHHCDAMECPYRYGNESCDIEEMCRDALALLKEQDAKVEPKRMYHAERASFDNYLCECKAELYYRQRYCDVCGRSVKWE